MQTQPKYYCFHFNNKTRSAPEEAAERWKSATIGRGVAWKDEPIITSEKGELPDMITTYRPFDKLFSAALKECMDSFVVDEPIQWNPVTIVNNGVEYRYYALVFVRPLDEIVCLEYSRPRYDSYRPLAFYPQKVKSYSILYDPTDHYSYLYLVTAPVAREIKKRGFTGIKLEKKEIIFAEE